MIANIHETSHSITKSCCWLAWKWSHGKLEANGSIVYFTRGTSGVLPGSCQERVLHFVFCHIQLKTAVSPFIRKIECCLFTLSVLFQVATC